jgi:hypothetical protein
MLMMLAMVCFVVSVTFAQKQQDPKKDPPPKPDQVKPKIDNDKGGPPPKNNDGNKGNDNKGPKKPS